MANDACWDNFRTTSFMPKGLCHASVGHRPAGVGGAEQPTDHRLSEKQVIHKGGNRVLRQRKDVHPTNSSLCKRLARTKRQFQTLADTSCSSKRRLQTVSVVAGNSGRHDEKVEVFSSLAKRSRYRSLRIGYAKINCLNRRRRKKS
jgi:hypothetical protein